MKKHAAMFALVGLALVAPLLALAPELMLNPSTGQTPEAVALAFRLRQLRSPLMLLMVAVGLVLTMRSWASRRTLNTRLVGFIPLFVLVASALLARVNLVERVFAPVNDLRFDVAAAVDHLPAGDMVLGVRVGEQMKAYPVRVLAYHHLINDELAGEPYVATY